MTFSYGVFTVFGLKGAFQYSNYEKFSTDCLLTVTGISFAYLINYAPLLCLRRRGGALSDTAIRLSVRLSVPWRSCPRRAAALGYRHASCLQLNHVRTAIPSADGRRSAASRIAIDGRHIVSPPPGGDNLLCPQLQYNIILMSRTRSG